MNLLYFFNCSKVQPGKVQQRVSSPTCSTRVAFVIVVVVVVGLIAVDSVVSASSSAPVDSRKEIFAPFFWANIIQ